MGIRLHTVIRLWNIDELVKEVFVRRAFIPILCLLWVVASAQAADSFAYPYTLELVADGFSSSPTAIVQPPDDADRLLIAELKGRVTLVKDGEVQPNPFLDLSTIISNTASGAGLHNLVFHPQYAENGYLYVVYTQPDRDEILVRYHVDSANPDMADPTSAFPILKIQHLTEFHYGGQLAFGPDGYLYWSMGDGAYKKSPAQNWKVLLGGILRLDVDGSEPYALPADNASVTHPDAKPELWAKGLRNPWRFSFDRLNGDLYIADVGEQSVEEINYLPANSPAGTNFGWSFFEGNTPFKATDKTGLTFPVVTYGHEGNCSITGGYVYRGEKLPALVGRYLFADYCSGWIWSTYQKSANNWYTAEVLPTNQHITTFGEDNAGELYIGAVGKVYKLGLLESN